MKYKHPIKWTPIRLLCVAAIIAIISTCLFLSFTFGSLFGGSFSKSVTTSTQNDVSKETTYLYWWQKRQPDVVVDEFDYYDGECSILQVNRTIGSHSATTIFKVSTSAFSHCKSRSLTHDGEYLIFSVCKMSFGAGGCGREQYRSADNIHWQEYIGITWIKSEQYEAWRNLGSTSSKADYVKKVVEQ